MTLNIAQHQDIQYITPSLTTLSIVTEKLRKTKHSKVKLYIAQHQDT